MHALQVQRVRGMGTWGMLAVTVVLAAAMFGAGAAIHTHRSLGLQGAAPAPAYVSNVSSMIGTADGTLIEGGTADSSAASVAQQGHPATGWLLIGLSVLGLSAVVLSVAVLYTKLCRRLT